MYKKLILSTVAAVGILGGVAPAAVAQDVNVQASLIYDNLLSHRLIQAHDNLNITTLFGFVSLEGTIDADSSATAITDTKQILVGNELRFREESFRDGRSGGVDSEIFGFQVDTDPDTEDNAIPIGYFAPIVNTVEEFSVTGTGNLGVNIASGWYNAQQNDAALATAGFAGGDDDDSGGWSEASLLSLQLLQGNTYGPFSLPERDEEEEDPESDAGFDDYRDRNTVTVGAITGDGNVGVNAAAGAFNIQQNAMTLAVSEDSVLARATAGVIQTALDNTVISMNTVNVVSAGGGISGSGNLGVNLAAGVGNMQHNSLTVATASGNGT